MAPTTVVNVALIQKKKNSREKRFDTNGEVNALTETYSENKNKSCGIEKLGRRGNNFIALEGGYTDE